MSVTTAAYLAALGGLIILIAWLPMFLKRLPLSLPIICVALGAGLATAIPEAHLSLFTNSRLAEELAEGALVMALLGSGLKIDRRFTWRGWQTTWRLLGIAMPATIAAVAVLAGQLGHWPLASALFLGAALAPTDPVLASGVSVGPPGRGEEGEIRFGLTSEAALNDGLAFPFVSLALVIGARSADAVTAGWVLRHFLVDVGGGLLLGWGFGRMFGWILFNIPAGRLSDTGDGIVAIGAAVITFAATEVVGLNGFLAVFAMATAMRSSCRNAKFHRSMASFSGQLERLATYLLLVGFGAALGAGLLGYLTWGNATLGLILIFVLRPLIGWISLIGSPHPPMSRALTAFLGIRGIGALYYLLYALSRGGFERPGELAAAVGFVILCSIALHGVTSTSLMRLADTRRERAARDRSEQDKSQSSEQV